MSVSALIHPGRKETEVVIITENTFMTGFKVLPFDHYLQLPSGRCVMSSFISALSVKGKGPFILKQNYVTFKKPRK